MRLPKYATDQAPRSRPGFSLIELMIVVAIIAVVASLVTSATMQVISRQRAANTELTIQEVNDALKAHWRAVIDQAWKETIPPNILYGDLTMKGLIAMAGGPEDPDSIRRARLLWIKLRLKQQFPMNFTEALDPTPNTIISQFAERRPRPYVLLEPAPVFSQALLGMTTAPWQRGQTPPPTPLAAANPQVYESSICLLLAISQGRKGVVPFDQDRLASTEIATVNIANGNWSNTLKVIVDGWGRPLTFYRWPIGAVPHLPIGGDLAASNPNKTASQIIGDPLDPDALLLAPGWNSPAAYDVRAGVWAFEKLFHPVRDVITNKPVSYYTVPVLASAGPVIGRKQPNQPYDYLNVYDFMGLPTPQEYGQKPQQKLGLPPALLHDPMDIAAGDPSSYDNIYSFRMRLGARGD